MVNFPDSLDDDATLFAAVNNLRTRLTVPISDTDTTVPVITTSGFPASGYFTILSSSDITKAEAIKYDTFSATQFTGVTRGADGTIAVEHLPNDNVDFNVVADHHNALKEATIKLEHFVGASGIENFVFRNPDTAQGTVDGNLLVSGTSAFVNNVDMRQRLTVSGIAQFGPIPQSTLPAALAVFDDTPGTVNSASLTLVLAGSPMPAGANLLLYRGNVGVASSSASLGPVEIEARFNGARVGFGEGQTGNRSGTKRGHFDGGEIAGFKVVTGDGVSFSDIRVRRPSGSAIVEHGSLGLVSIPLGLMGLVENTDYWFDNGTDTSTNNTNSSFTDVEPAFNFTVPDDGDYLIFFTCELSASFEGRIRVELDPSSSDFVMTAAEIGSGIFSPCPFAVVRTLSAGAHTLQMQQSTQTGFGGVSTRNRRRFFVIRAASFDQIQGIRSADDQSTTSPTSVELTAYSQTYSPNANEQLLILGTAGYTGTFATDTSAMGYKLVNITDNEDYRTDSGMPLYDPVNPPETSNTLYRPTLMFHLLDDVSTPKDFEMQFRDAGNDGKTHIHTDGSLVFWGLSLPPATPDILITTITIDEITTHQLDLDLFTATQSATVSGAAVMIGLPDEATFQNINTTNITATGTADFHIADVDILTTVTGSFSESLTVSGFPVTINASVFDPSADETVTGSWNFSSSLTVSGIPVSTGTGGGGVSDHGALTGLADNDHPQYGQLADTETVTGAWDFSTSLTVSGSPVSTGTLTVRETDGTPTVLNVNTIVVTTGTLTDDGDGQVTITTGGGGGGGGSSTLQEAYDIGDGIITTAGGKPLELAGTGELVAVTGTFTGGLTVGSSSSLINNTSITTGSGIFTNSLTVSGIPVQLSPTQSFEIRSRNFSGALVSKDGGSNQDVSATVVAQFENEVYDTDGFFDPGSDTRFTIPADLGIVKIKLSGVLRFSPDSPTAQSSQLVLQIDKNGSALSSPQLIWKVPTIESGGAATSLGFQSPDLEVVDGDFFSLDVQWANGGATPLLTAIRTWFQIEVVERNAPVVLNEFTSVSGTFDQSLTISGVPVVTGTGEFLIHQEFTDASSTSITFEIPQTARVLSIDHSVRISLLTDDLLGMLIQFNGDTGSNYARHQYLHTDDDSHTIGTPDEHTSDTVQYLDATTVIIIGQVPGASAVANSFGAGHYTIPNYTNTAVWKSITGTAMAFSDDGNIAGLKSRLTTGGGTWKDTSAITEIRIFHSSGRNFETGSSITIRGY